jgi:hypothetical protein
MLFAAVVTFASPFEEGVRIWTAIDHKADLDDTQVPPELQVEIIRQGALDESRLLALPARQQTAIIAYLEDVHNRLTSSRAESEKETPANDDSTKIDLPGRSASPSDHLGWLSNALAVIALVPDSQTLGMLWLLMGAGLVSLLAWPDRVRGLVCGSCGRRTSFRNWKRRVPVWTPEWEERERQKLETKLADARESKELRTAKAKEFRNSRSALRKSEIRIAELIRQLQITLRDEFKEGTLQWEVGTKARTWRRRATAVAERCMEIHWNAEERCRAIVDDDELDAETKRELSKQCSELSEQAGRALYCWYYCNRSRDRLKTRDQELKPSAWNGDRVAVEERSLIHRDRIDWQTVQNLGLLIVWEACGGDKDKFEDSLRRFVPVEFAWDSSPIQLIESGSLKSSKYYGEHFDSNLGPSYYNSWETRRSVFGPQLEEWQR